MSEPNRIGTLALSLKDPWVSDKALTRSFLKFFIPFTVVFIPVMYLLYPQEGILIPVIIFGALFALLLGHLAYGKDKWILTIPTVRRRDKREYGEIYWRLVGFVESVLKETGFQYVEVSDWPRKTYRIVGKGFDVVISAAIDSDGIVERFQMVIHPVTSENYVYIDGVKRRLSEAILGDGLIWSYN